MTIAEHEVAYPSISKPTWERIIHAKPSRRIAY
jgi:hypothetical protein